jgi:hypothetical protein
MSKEEESIIAKLRSEGLSLASPKDEIMACLGRCVGAKKLQAIAENMLETIGEF